MTTNGPSASGRSPQDAISLRLWLFKFNPDVFQVTVEGYFVCDKEGTLRNWGTSAIKKRHKNTLLESETGKFYKLVGEIDESQANHCGYPASLIKCFKQGFPTSWERMLKEYYDVVKSTNPLNASVWFEKNHRRESMSALRDDRQSGGGQASAALRRRQSRLSVLPSVPMIEENSFEGDESVKENRATPKSIQHKAVTDTIDREATVVRRSPRLAICDTPHNVIGQQKTTSDSPHATLEIVETPRRGRPPRKDQEEVEKKSATPAGTPRKTPNLRARTPRGTTPAASTTSTPRASRSATREGTPAVTASKSTPRPRTAKSRDVTPAPEKTTKSTPRKSNARSRSIAAPKQPPQILHEASDSTPTSSKNASNKKTPARGQSIDSQVAEKPSPKPQTLTVAEETPILAGSPQALPNLVDDSLFKMPEMPQKKKQRGVSVTSSIGNGKAQTLTDWHIRFMPELEKKSKDHPPFILVGQNIDRPDMTQDWNTTIIHRVSPEGTSFFTLRGSEYRVQGIINVHAMAKDGFNKTFVADFFNGFPANWVQTLWTAYNLKKGLPAEGDQDQPIVTHPASDGEASHTSNKSAYKKRKSNPSDTSSNNLSIVPFDQSRLNNSGEVKTSSRGRVVKPVMPTWAGQRVRYSTNGDVIGMETSAIHCDEAVDMNSFADHFGVPRVEEAPNLKRKSFAGALHCELDTRQRVQPKKRLVTYSSSSSGDDSDVVTRTMRIIEYDDIPLSKHRRSAKARRLNEETDSEEEREQEEKILKRIAKRKKKAMKAIKELPALEKLQQKVLAKREERRQRSKMAEHARRRDEEWEVEQMELERQQRQKQKSLQAKKKQQQQQKKQPKRQVYEEETSDDEVFEGSIGDSGDSSSSTDTEVSDDGGEWVRTPAQKRGVQRVKQQKKKARKEQKKAQSRGDKKQRKEVVMESEEDSEEEEEEEVVRKERKPKVKKPTWNDRDLDRLKLAMKASKVRSEEDWEVIARSLGGQFPAADCKEMAIKKLKWVDEQDAYGHNNNERDSDEGEMRVTARQGTLGYQIQADQQSRKYMMGAGSQEEDCFRNREIRDEEDDFIMPNMGEFDPDDSLLEALKTPKQAAPVGRKGANRRPFVAGPLIGDDDTPTIVKRRSSTIRNEEMDSAERENHQRRLRHLLNDKRHFNNTTRMNNTSMMQNHSMADHSRAVLDVEKKFDRIQRKLERQKPKKRREFDEEDEDELEEEF